MIHVQESVRRDVQRKKPLNLRLLDQIHLDELVARIHVQESVSSDVQRKKPLNPRLFDKIHLGELVTRISVQGKCPERCSEEETSESAASRPSSPR